jgi:uncharacterized protein (TIGR03663 family)
VIALALFFASDPILVYYSRFMRNDVLLAAFAVAGVGLFVRLIDTGRRRYLYAGVAAFALAFTTKENAVVYVVTLAGGSSSCSTTGCSSRGRAIPRGRPS